MELAKAADFDTCCQLSGLLLLAGQSLLHADMSAAGN